MNNDAWGRTVVMTTDGVTDTYTVGADSEVGDRQFSLAFPAGADLNTLVYPAINGIAPCGGGGTATDPDLLPAQAFLGSGATQDRPQTADGPPPGLGVFLGQYYFDTSLRKPIWFVGYGTTGWVDALGNQV